MYLMQGHQVECNPMTCFDIYQSIHSLLAERLNIVSMTTEPDLSGTSHFWGSVVLCMLEEYDTYSAAHRIFYSRHHSHIFFNFFLTLSTVCRNTLLCLIDKVSLNYSRFTLSCLAT